MQAIIMAAGRGTRMDELTTAVPKPMLLVNGKTLLEHKLDAFPEEIDEVVIVVGYLANVIRTRFGGEYNGKKLTYVEQAVLNGTAGALWDCKDILRDTFLVMTGDDIYAAEDIEKCIGVEGRWSCLVQQMEHMYRAGAVDLDTDANVIGIIEGDRGEEPGLACTNMFYLDKRLFTQPLIPKQEGSLEFGLPQTVIAAAKGLSVRLEPIFTTDWIQINSPADLVRAGEILKKRQEEAKKTPNIPKI